MQKQLLIVGIDPGTTIGYAVIDLDGRLISIGSSKLFDIAKLTSEIINHGRVGIVGCDKRKIPDFVVRISKRLGARVIRPDEDLRVFDKKKITKGFEYKNDHEMDALASALFAFKRIKPLLGSVKEVVEKENKHEIKDKLTEIILHDPEFNIKNIVEILDKPKREEKEVKIVEGKRLPDFSRLFDKAKKLEKDISLVKDQNKRFKQEIQEEKKKRNVLLKLLGKNKEKENVSFLKKRLSSVSSKMDLQRKKIQGLEKELEKVRLLLSDVNDRVIVKRLVNLGNKEFESKKKILKIKKKDILFVDDLSVVSYKVLDYLKDKVGFIISRKKSNGRLLDKYGITVVNAGKIDIKEEEYFASVDKKDLDEVIGKSNMLDVIVRDYREGRE